ncbi:MAG: nucleotidyltransferase family protein [Rhodospirillaceae bacterium]
MSQDENSFLDLIKTNPINDALLRRLPDLGLPDSWLVSGSLFQTVWNAQTGRPPTYGIKDYDLFYFEPGDLSWEAEDAVILRCKGVFSDIKAEVQVRNQARVHVWYAEKFGAPYPPLKSSCDGIDRFTTPSSMYGVGHDDEGNVQVYAPHGYSDAFDLVVRPNQNSTAVEPVYAEKTTRWKALWPELTVIPF